MNIISIMRKNIYIIASFFILLTVGVLIVLTIQSHSITIRVFYPNGNVIYNAPLKIILKKNDGACYPYYTSTKNAGEYIYKKEKDEKIVAIIVMLEATDQNLSPIIYKVDNSYLTNSINLSASKVPTGILKGKIINAKDRGVNNFSVFLCQYKYDLKPFDFNKKVKQQILNYDFYEPNHFKSTLIAETNKDGSFVFDNVIPGEWKMIDGSSYDIQANKITDTGNISYENLLNKTPAFVDIHSTTSTESSMRK